MAYEPLLDRMPTSTPPRVRDETGLGERPRYAEEAPFKIHGGCGLMGICDESGALMSGVVAIKAMAVQRDRGNGLGGGFAGYGIYPEFPDHFCFHMMYHDVAGQGGGRGGLRPATSRSTSPSRCRPVRSRASATRRCCGATSCSPTRTSSRTAEMTPEDFVVHTVMLINSQRRRRVRRLVRQEHGRLQGRRLPRGDRPLLPARGVRGPHLDRPQPLPDQHARLVGRRAPVHAARLVDRAQRRDLELRHQQPLPRAVRLQVHARHRHRGRGVPVRPAAAPPQAAARRSRARRSRARCGPRSTACPRTSRPSMQSLRAVYGPGDAQRPVRHRARLQRRHGRAERPHQAAPARRRAPGRPAHGRLRGERDPRGPRRARTRSGRPRPASRSSPASRAWTGRSTATCTSRRARSAARSPACKIPARLSR